MKFDRVTPDVIRSCQQMMALDPVECAFRAVACLDSKQRAALAARFNQVFEACSPSLTLAFTEVAR